MMLLPGFDPYIVADDAMRRGDPRAARAALRAVIDAHPDSVDAATALLDLARLDVRAGDHRAARRLLDRLDRHPQHAVLAGPAARLRALVTPR